MTPFPLSIESTASLGDAEILMTEHSIRHLPVTEEGELLGILAHRDLQVLKASLANAREREQMTITSVVIRQPFVVDCLEPINVVAAEMVRRHIGSALVLYEGKLAGIFTMTDACRYLSEILSCMYDSENEIA